MNLQHLVNQINLAASAARADSQLTLGRLISVLKKMPVGKILASGIHNPHSYRGYYVDLCFEPTENEITVSNLLKLCEDSVDHVFTGWKGGDFMMHLNTPLWVANKGNTGKKMMFIDAEGNFKLEEDSL